jgi:hypothetical protein
MADDTAWYYCLTHQTVEHGPGCRSADRMGPYATEAEAAAALETARRRTRQWDEDDHEWNNH